MIPGRPTTARLALFAFGDFAFNLYWQSVMLYLLFYYTDSLKIGMETAGAIYLAASVWDGFASFIVGTVADRRGSARQYRLALIIGAVPLGLAFAMAYMAPPVAGALGVAFVVVGHIAFRTAYALVNVPYLAMTARVSADSRDRSFVAGLRMLAGTVAAVIVASQTVPTGQWLAGTSGPRAYLYAALLFAAIATVILLIVGATFRDAAPEDSADHPSIRACIASVATNRAFLTLSAAMMAMIVATTILGKSVLYYFKYFLHDAGAGQLALAAMMAVSAIAVPVWMALARWIGVRAVWFVAVAWCIAGLAIFGAVGFARVETMRWFLIAMQGAIVGLHFAFWAMLPDTIEFGQRTSGLRAEGTVFGLATLLQRVAIGVATAILGWGFGEAGYRPDVAQTDATLSGMRATIALVPLGFFLISGVFMLLNPLAKGTHDRIVRDLTAG